MQENLDCLLTLSKNNKGVISIRVKDTNSRIEFIEIKLTPEELAEALFTAARPCKVTLNQPENVGKQRISEEVIIEIKKSNNQEEAKEKALELSANDGWNYETSFRSQNSFFSKDNKNYARTNRFKYI